VRYDVIEKIGEGNRGEVYKVKLEDGTFAALKWAKSYKIDKEWNILSFLNGKYAPKPIFRGKKYLVMELIEGIPLKELIGTKDYYVLLKQALEGAYYLDRAGVFHKQLGRYYHILKTDKGARFIDFERSVFSEKPRNFLQLVGYYLQRDENFDKKEVEKIAAVYKTNPKNGLLRIKDLFDEIIENKFLG